MALYNSELNKVGENILLMGSGKSVLDWEMISGLTTDEKQALSDHGALLSENVNEFIPLQQSGYEE